MLYAAARMAAAVANYAPPQLADPAVHDFRCARGKVPRGYTLSRKRKMDDLDAQVERDAVAAMEGSLPVAVPGEPRRVRAKHDVVGLGKASGRPWKEPAQRASTLKPATLSSTWEKKMALKAARATFVAAKRDAVESRKARKRVVRVTREAALERRRVAREGAAITQTITSSATLKRMMKNKKQAKLLRKADTTKVVKG
jgi:rRNA-processing protein CGR1